MKNKFIDSREIAKILFTEHEVLLKDIEDIVRVLRYSENDNHEQLYTRILFDGGETVVKMTENGAYMLVNYFTEKRKSEIKAWVDEQKSKNLN